MSGSPIEIGPASRAVAAKVRLLRRRRGLRLEDLSALLTGVGRPMLPTVLSKLERCTRRIDIDDLVAIAAALGTTAAGLLEPPEACSACLGAPPAGFACLSCGAGS